MDSPSFSHDPSFGMANEAEWSWPENKAFELPPSFSHDPLFGMANEAEWSWPENKAFELSPSVSHDPSFGMANEAECSWPENKAFEISPSVSHDPSFGMANEAEWSWPENKAFELSLVRYPEGTPNRWSLIAAHLPTKSPRQASDHYRALIHDLDLIESGRVEPPHYENEAKEGEEDDNHGGQPIFLRSQSRHQSQERRRAVPWTEEEHRSFLRGLEHYGKGDWKNISRYAVKTRTPTQVASHAQKFYLRLEQHKESKRRSIHDITKP